ncbi:OPT/YSL family transporter [Prauserella cavernicola]|uniref:OPT/YSL family transporter n=1 Tax=Prauserella cavernicola TaxID=2800127 RepID=A0A934QNM0_9PSEU|nr:OPT/YSL family transporter [Prauserella cavernicola]MBK1783815.1 OPT/YSL family transporter [Prauserella cavernicola]
MSAVNRSRQVSDPTHRHPRVIEPVVLATTLGLSVLGAVVGMHMITTLGVTANTSIVGALLAMLIGRVSVGGLKSMRSPHRQNLAQTSISAATFSAANSLLTPMAVLFAFGRADLVWPMLIGAVVALFVDGYVLYRLFGSPALPAEAAWPPGVAAAETIKAGDRGGKQAMILGAAGAVGLAGSLAGLSMSAAGVALIGNAWALSMFGLGLLTAQYAPDLLNIDLEGLYLPHGLMIGAGIVALVQASAILLRRRSRTADAERADSTLAEPETTASSETSETSEISEAPAADEPTAPAEARSGSRGLAEGLGLFLGGALLLALISGIAADMSVLGIIGWIVFAGVAALVHEIIVGLAAMHAGWFPAFAVTLIFLLFGLLLGIPGLPLAVLTGYCAATGPAFADMGYDLKAGWILRRDEPGGRRFELSGRRQQYFASMIGFVVAAVVVALLWERYFTAGEVPPVAEVYATTILQGLSDPDVLLSLAIWAVPGAIIQLIGGSSRQLGVLLATGLLVATADAGWLVVGALAIRFIYRKLRGPRADKELALVGAGMIAGDAIAATSKVVQ